MTAPNEKTLQRIEDGMQQILAFLRVRNEKLLSDKSVAAMLDVSRDQVWRMTRAGVLPKPYIMKSPTKSRGSTRWKHSEICAYIASLEVQPC